MKKLLFSLLLITLPLSYSCEKESLNCYVCTVIPDRYHSSFKYQKTYCGMTAKEIRQIEKEGTYTIGDIKRTTECRLER